VTGKRLNLTVRLGRPDVRKGFGFPLDYHLLIARLRLAAIDEA
jgi:hypothetical protein